MTPLRCSFLGVLLAFSAFALFWWSHSDSRFTRQWIEKARLQSGAEKEAAIRWLKRHPNLAVEELKKMLQQSDSGFRSRMVNFLEGTLGLDWNGTSATIHRAHAVWLAGELGPEAADLAPMLLRCAREPSLHVPFSQLRNSLLAIGPSIHPACLESITDPPHPGLFFCLAVLADSVKQFSWSNETQQFALEPLNQLLHHPDSTIRNEVISLLGQLHAFPIVASEGIAAGFLDPEPAVRANAAKTIRSFPEQARAHRTTLARMLLDPNEMVRVQAANSCGHLQFDNPETIRRVADLLKDPSTVVRNAAALALGRLNENAALAVPQLISALHDKEDQIRSHAALALANIGSAAAPAVDDLMELLRTCEDPVKISVIQALGGIGPKAAPAVQLLHETARNNHSGMYPHVTLALSKIQKGKQ